MDKSEEKSSVSRAARSATFNSRPEYAELGKWIRVLRESKGLQQKPLSRKMGKPEHFLNRVESGRQRIDVIELLDFLEEVDPEAKQVIQSVLNY